MLSQLAQKLFETLPADGSKIGGITLRRELEISKVEYVKAREELKGLVVIGGGRGGSLARVEGAEFPVENKKTKIELLEIAREEKKAKGRARKDLDEQIALVYRWAKEKLDYEVKKRSDVVYYMGQWGVAVWSGHQADVVMIPQLDMDMMRAKKVR